MVESAGGFRLAEKALFDLLDLLGIDLVEADGLDCHLAVDLGITPQVDRPHRPPPQLFLDLEATDGRHRRATSLQDDRVLFATAGSAEDHRFTGLFHRADTLGHILEFTGGPDMFVNRGGLVEHALALEIQRQVIEQIPDSIVFHRAFAELLEGQVQQSLPLKRQAQHLVGFDAVAFHQFLALFGHHESGRDINCISDYQQQRRRHHAQPLTLAENETSAPSPAFRRGSAKARNAPKSSMTAAST